MSNSPPGLPGDQDDSVLDATRRGGTPSTPERTTDPAPEEIQALRSDPRRILNQYVLTVQLGAGGMGYVWKAWDTKLTRWVAIKFLNSMDESSVRRFQREAQMAGRLRHPNIATVYEVNEFKGLHYLVMEYIDGTPMNKANLPMRNAIEALTHVCRAVDYAHENSVIHRDLKPANIMISKKNQPFVTDFGLAKVSQSDSSISVEGAVLGTPSYMAPEQVTGQMQEIDTRSDIYSLGATLYEVTTGRRPFEADNHTALLYKITTQAPVAPRKLNPEVPEAVDRVILKAMAKDKKNRYATAGEMAEDLDRYLQEKPVLAPPRRSRRGYRLGAIAAAGVALAIVGFFALRNRKSDPTTPGPTPEDTSGRNSRKGPPVRSATFLTSLEENKQGIRSIAFSPDGKLLASGSYQEIRIWDAAAQKVLRSMEGHSNWVSSLAFSPDGKALASGSLDSTVKLWSVTEESSPRPLPGTAGAVLCVASSPAGNRLASASWEDKIKLWEWESNKELSVAFPYHGVPQSVAFDPKGTLFASADQYVFQWGEDLEKAPRTLSTEPSTVRCLAFSPDGRLLAIANNSGTIRILKMPSAQPLWTLSGHAREVISVAFHPKGTTLASASEDGTVRLWNVETGQETMKLEGHTGAVQCVAFQPGGKLLASGSADRTIRLWSLGD